MKAQVKKFSQFVNENEFMNNNRKQLNLVEDLLDCYIRENHENDTVLVLIDINSSARDLVDGGITLTVNPTEREIGDAQYDGNYHAELYQNGRRSIEGDDDGQFGEYYQK